MAQKTLLSFFKKAPPVIASPQSSANNQESVKEECISPESSANNKESVKVKDECINDSPIKQPNKRRRLNPIIDSDEESSDSNDIQKKDSCSSQASNEKSKSLEKEEHVNGDSNKMSNGVTIKEVKDKDKTQDVEFIPKRKTARKAMKGGLKGKAISSKENSSIPDTTPEPMDVSNTDSKSDKKDTPFDASNQMDEMEVDKSSNENEADEKKSPKEMTENDSPSSEKGIEESSPKTVKKDKKVEEVEEPVKKVKEEVEEPVKKVKEEVEEPVKKVKEEVEEPVKKIRKEVEKPAKNKKEKRTKSSGKKKIKKEAEDSGSDKNKSDSNESGAESADEEDLKKKGDSSSVKENPAIHPFFASASKKVDSGSKGESKATSSSSESSSSKEKSKINLSSSPGNVYNPSKSPYHPIDDACWKQGEKVPYLALAKTLELIESTSARLLMIEILSNFLRSVIVLTPDDLIYCVYLCLNRLAPEYEGIELGVGETLLMKAVAQATGRTVDKIKAEVAVKGDLGLVAESSRGHQRVMFAPPKLTVCSVFSKFKEIAKMSGNSAMAKKTDKIQALFVACRDCEAKYIIRTLSGKLRIGLAEQSVLAALARAAVITPPNQTYPPEMIDKSAKMSADKFKQYLNEKALILKTTYCECPNYDLIIPVLLKEGIDALPEHCQLTPGCPLKPMLAQPTNGIAEVLNRFDKNEFTCEFKYDGERAQIHMTDKGEVKIYSRNQEDNTSKYPDVISRISKTLHESTKTFILDTEAVAWDKETKQILPFQVLSTRKKKDAVESDIVVQVCIMAFDLLYLNGESLVKKTLKERRALLHSSFIEIQNEFMFVNYKDGNSAETMQEYLDESIKGNCEGLMVKALTVDASYEIAKRSHNWLKLKKDYLKGIGDTLDLVVIGGYHGKGKRTGNYGGFLLACYDEENEEFQSICKLGTGFSEEELETHTKFLKEHVIKEPRSYYRYDSSLEPDEWFDAVQIWEIKCADLSISPVHKAAQGIVDPEKGISLRFPRFLRIRDDKTKPEDCTSATQIAELYQNQEQVQNTANKNVKTEEDYY